MTSHGIQPEPWRAGASQRRFGVPADPDARVRLLHRLGFEPHVAELHELALVAGCVLGPEDLHHFEVLVGDPASLLERHTEGTELVLGVADPDGEHHTATRQHVERGHGFRERDGLVVREHDHGRVHREARGRTRDERHRSERVRPVRAHHRGQVVRHDDVLGHLDRVVAEVVGGPRDELEVGG